MHPEFIKITKHLMLPIILVLIAADVHAQQYEDMYRANDGTVLRIDGNNRSELNTKGVTILLSDEPSQINVLLQLPVGARNFPFNLKVNIDQNAIQDNLTSTKTFNSRGTLLLNGITEFVEVRYIAMPTGTDEEGDFLLNLLVNFNAADFHLPGTTNSTRFTIMVNRAKINRLQH